MCTCVVVCKYVGVCVRHWELSKLFDYLKRGSVYWNFFLLYCGVASPTFRVGVHTTTATDVYAHADRCSFIFFCCSLCVWVHECVCVGVTKPFSWQQCFGNTSNHQSWAPQTGMNGCWLEIEKLVS